MLDTPVLFIVFNRPETTKRVFEAIRQAKPRQLFVAADGPRPEKLGEKERCEDVRVIATNVDWDCEVHTLFRSKNVGCGRGPAEAITWFFEHVDRGIILEDDCLPSSSFFLFCKEMLEKYDCCENVFLVSGFNPLDESSIDSSYIFSRYAGIWGWATWRRAWINYDFNMASWENIENRCLVQEFLKKNSNAEYFYKRFDQTFKGIEVSWWDYQWFYCRIIHRALGIVPSINLIQNIGFGPEATHTLDALSIEANRKASELKWPLLEPLSEVNNQYDSKLIKYYYPQTPFLVKVKIRISRYVNKILSGLL